MPARHKNRSQLRPSASFIILCCLLTLLWVAGGASRADVLAQVIVRLGAFAALVAFALIGDKVRLAEARVPWIVLTCATALVLMQLIPLPYSIWSQIPGRETIAAFVADSRPWGVVTLNPGATLNAAFSLVIPLAILLGLSRTTTGEQQKLLPAIIIFVLASAALGLIQFSLGYFDNPLLNDTPWQVNGPFANRNHFALLLAIGCLIVPASIVQREWRSAWWTGLIPVVLVLLLLLILATGSRTGVLLGAIGTLIGLGLAAKPVSKRLRARGRWLAPAVALTVVVAIGTFVAISIFAGRAMSIERMIGSDEENLRALGLPTVLQMARNYLPFGAGSGSFDTAFRIHEPYEFLRPNYFNHAHNDLLEIVVESGVLGLALLSFSLGWWAIKSIQAWRSPSSADYLLPRLGSATIFLVIVASAADYPARTPIVMALIVIAAIWLNGARKSGSPPLPEAHRNL